ncbi:phytoene desaturase family protein [Paenibacillus ehimensis]|uniref:FAD-dependent oxidoreductase n=1 Tax=Paenibacillus ehimensis TaxID=79264 RepID=A0ABT8V5H8_9BACL|nr:FAD-dependent oxidoreductase [Paenibacillus ehimensis]MDO3676680.1 FAD-dependent oxidoreductase [Paenibacillus ehimensis]
MNRKRYDAAVIGGGLAGWIAAIELARAGKSVVLLEKSNRMGGRARTADKRSVLFNLGGHALYLGGELHAVLQEWGVQLEGGRASSSPFAIWHNRVFPMPADPVKLLASPLLSWRGKTELVRLLFKLGRIATDTLETASLREWAEKEIGEPMARHIFYALCRTATFTQDPDLQAAGPVLKQVQRSLKNGVLYINGGWQTIVDRLEALAVSAGVHILSGKAVSAVEQTDGAVSRVTCSDGETFELSQVISTLPPADTYRLVRNAEHTMLRRWKEEARPSMAACLDLGLKRLPTPGRNLAFGLDQPVFFSNQSASAKLSEHGTIVVHLLKYNNTGGSDPKADERMLEQTMSLLHPGWEREVVERQYLPAMPVVHDYMHLGRTSRFPGPAVPEIRGLYVAGDWASHGEMLADAAAASARRAARQAAAELDRIGRRAGAEPLSLLSV